VETIKLTLAAEYVPEWSTWEALRELFQNALDAEDAGHAFSLAYDSSHEQLRITSAGVVLERSTLLLGSSTKRGGIGNVRGYFGEGYKLALLVLVRSGHDVVIHNGAETWKPRLTYSAEFESVVLGIDVEPAPLAADGLTFCVRSITHDMFVCARDRCLRMTALAPTDVITVLDGKTQMLVAPEYKGAIYVKDLYVGHDETLQYGYNFQTLALDRDRKIPSAFSISAVLGPALIDALITQALPTQAVYELLNADCGEARAIYDTRYSAKRPEWQEAATHLAQFFCATYGENSVPVRDNALESAEAARFGLRGIQVSSALLILLELHLGTFEEAKARACGTIGRYVEFTELSQQQQHIVTTALTLVDHELDDVAVNIVEFSSASPPMGTFTADYQINVSVSTLTGSWTEQFRKFFETLVHELAHKYGPDGSVEHERAMERIFGTVVTKTLVSGGQLRPINV
jgi:hypothetical protein